METCIDVVWKQGFQKPSINGVNGPIKCMLKMVSGMLGYDHYAFKNFTYWSTCGQCWVCVDTCPHDVIPSQC